MIGVIVKTDKEIEELSQNWVPEKFQVPDVMNAFFEALGYEPSEKQFCHDDNEALIHFTIDDFSDLRAITFNCTLIGKNTAIIKIIANNLNARIFDSESGTFLNIENV